MPELGNSCPVRNPEELGLVYSSVLVLECLSSKLEALGSIPSTPKRSKCICLDSKERLWGTRKQAFLNVSLSHRWLLGPVVSCFE